LCQEMRLLQSRCFFHQGIEISRRDNHLRQQMLPGENPMKCLYTFFGHHPFLKVQEIIDNKFIVYPWTTELVRDEIEIIQAPCGWYYWRCDGRHLTEVLVCRDGRSSL